MIPIRMITLFILITLVFSTVAINSQTKYKKWQQPDRSNPCEFNKLYNSIRILYERGLRDEAASPEYLSAIKSILDQYSSTSTTEPIQGLVAWYPFNGTADDRSGNGNYGTNNGATLTTDRSGVSKAAYYFDGTSYVTLSSAQQILGSNPLDWSYSTWFKVASFNDDWQSVFNDYNSAGSGDLLYGIRIDLSPQNKIQASVSAGYNRNYAAFSIQSINSRQWYNVSVVVDRQSQKLRLYVNGIFQSEIMIEGAVNYIEDVPLNVGRIVFNGTTGEGFHGSVCDIRIYNRALSDIEIQALYNMGK